MRDNKPIQAKCLASVTNCVLGLETAMAPTVNSQIGDDNFSLTVNTGIFQQIISYYREIVSFQRI